jgi:serine/threonine protein kinase
MTIQSFCNLLARSRLYPPYTVREIFLRWQSESPAWEDLPAFTRWLVASGYLTDYQAGILIDNQGEGLVLDSYRILDRIGKGRTTGVFRAADAENKVVAIKILPSFKGQDPQTLARFQREARLAILLQHPTLVRTLDIGQEGDLHYLVMEYLDGVTLRDLLGNHGALPPIEAARIAFLATLGLQHLYDKGLVHRDLTPGNIMLCPAPPPGGHTLRSMVKILDIGLGRKLYDPRGRGRTEGLTNEDDLLGSPDYLAPEQARDPRRADIRADVYSLGCVLFHMLSGRPPFQDAFPIRQLLRHANEEPPSLHKMNRAISPQLDQIVLTMLAKDPRDRYQTPAALGKALREFLASQPFPGAPTRR